MSSQAKGEDAAPETPPNTSFSSHLARFKHSPTPPPYALSKLPSPPISPSSATLARRNARPAKLQDSSATSRHFKRAASEQEPEEQEDSEEVKPAKKKKGARSFAHPSVYAHLGGLTDSIRAGLDIILCGINPGVESGRTNCHYAHPTNHLWRCIHRGGFSEKLLTPEEGQHIADLTKPSMGLTNLVERPTAEAAELSKEEQEHGAPVFLAKVLACRPKIVAFAGMGVCDVFHKYLWSLPPAPASAPLPSSSAPAPTSPSKPPRRPARPKVPCGLQPFTLSYPRADGSGERDVIYFVALPSPSGLVVRYQLTDKIVEFAKLKSYIEQMDASPGARLPFPSLTPSQSPAPKTSTPTSSGSSATMLSDFIDYPVETLEERMALQRAAPKVIKRARAAKSEFREEVAEGGGGERVPIPRRKVTMVRLEDLKLEVEQ